MSSATGAVYIDFIEILFYLDETVLLCAGADLLGIVEIMRGLSGLDALQKMLFAVVGRVAHGVKTGAVYSHRVERGEDAEVGHFGRCGIAVAVTVNREIVGDIDIKGILRPDVVDNGF